MVGKFTKLSVASDGTRRQVMSDRPIEILVVEDDLGDIDLIQEAFADTQFPVKLNFVRDGVKAIAYLRRQGEYTNTTLPNLILLDLNLPCKGGLEVLKVIKSDDNLKQIPAIILTTSDADEDICNAYKSGANCYLNKPIGLEEYIQLIKSIENFWFTVVKLPPKEFL